MLRKTILVLCLSLGTMLIAQEQTDKQEKNQELQALLKRIEALEQKQKKSDQKDLLAALKAKAQMLSQKKRKKDDSETRKFHSGLRQQSSMNPNISLGGDFYTAYGTSDSKYNRLQGDRSWGTGRFFLREMELSLQAPLDPFTRGKVFLAFGQEGVVLEEGYMEWLNLPLGMNLKVGEFKTQFGQLNRYHDHAMPQFDRPYVLNAFFGTGSLKGFGVAANFLLPSMTAHVNELDLEVVSGGTGMTFTNESKHDLIFVGHYKNYYDLNRSTYLELGFSGTTGYTDADASMCATLGAIDLTIKWAPPGRAKYRGLEWRTELIYGQRELPGETVKSWGGYSYLQYRTGPKHLIGVRADYTQFPENNIFEEKGFSILMDYWQTEFVFLRFQYSMINRNFDENDHRFIVQTCWAMGPHKHETY
ncbi:hypothetical protein KAR48_08900 [bacterium]|nr:hypothetical protein [bacterium]